MSDMELDDVKAAAAALSMWAHIATVGADGEPDVVPVHPCWEGDTVHDDLETKRRLWTGVFDYDLNACAPGGPDTSPGTGFMAVEPTRAMVMKAYGMGGVNRWSASA
jgi:hypothetical protein